jgi:excisionase family DNA binding protein
MVPSSIDIDHGSEADSWLTVAEFADVLRVRPVTVRSWISKGELPATRAGKRKWLVRRSELDRMLHGTEGAPPPPLASDRVVEKRPPAATAPETRFPTAIGTRDSVKKLLEYASDSMSAAFRASALAPPSTGYTDRLRAIADGFEHFAATSIHAGNTAGATWSGRDDWDYERLPYEVRPGGNRPTRPGLWEVFDSAFAALGEAMAGHDIIALGQAFRKAAVELMAVADQLEGHGVPVSDSHAG